MAVASPVIDRSVAPGDGSVILYTWALTAANAVGAPVEVPQWADRCFQVYGTWNGATVVCEGSNVFAGTYGTLNNAQGSAISHSADGAPKQIVEVPRWVRPSSSGGGGSTALTVTLLVRRFQQRSNA